MALAAQKGGLLGEQTAGLREVDSAPMIADDRGLAKSAGSCARCGRRLTNPHSVARSLGPVCYRKSGGGMFDRDMQASDAEWERRAEDLRRGGEVDFGWWDCVQGMTEYGPAILQRAMRVSVRFRDGAFEAYGVLAQVEPPVEQIFYRGNDIRECWRAAIAAGPESSAAAYRARWELTRAWKAQARAGKQVR